MWPFRPSQIPSNGPDDVQTHRRTHDSVLDLIEQVAALRGQVRNIEMEWESVRVQIRKDYQRVEKGNERAEKRMTMEEDGNSLADSAGDARGTEPEPLHGFAEKLRQMKGT